MKMKRYLIVCDIKVFMYTIQNILFI